MSRRQALAAAVAVAIVSVIALGLAQARVGLSLDMTNVGTCPGSAPAPKARCLTLPVQLIVKTTVSQGGCGRFMVMQVRLRSDVVEYEAEWTNINKGAQPWLFTASGGSGGSGSGPYGQPWSTTALTPQNTGVDVNYKVPRGYGAWYVDAGGGPGPCDLRTGTARAWGWT